MRLTVNERKAIVRAIGFLQARPLQSTGYTTHYSCLALDWALCQFRVKWHRRNLIQRTYEELFGFSPIVPASFKDTEELAFRLETRRNCLRLFGLIYSYKEEK